MLARLSEDARKNVLQIDLKRWALSLLDSFPRADLAVRSLLLIRSCFLTGGACNWRAGPVVNGPISTAPALTGDDQHGGQLGDLEAGFFFADSHVDQWQSLEDVWMHGYWGWDWANSYEAVCVYATRAVA